ncbi:MAG: ABC-2 family transporter protein [Pseudomonadales bacterium]|nr:ABC-2 family transporter protein [Candidatus Woesebacteria bacterium]MCB9801737.1 ABC-2 family transporter protein [Pseudomonadales bacterium]
MTVATYLQYFKIYLAQTFEYRTSFFMWRIRQVLSLLLSLFFWGSVYADTATISAYTKDDMIAYLIITNLVFNLVAATSLNSLGSFIYSGELSNFLIKPQNISLYLLSKEAADKLQNLFFSLLEAGGIWLLFQPQTSISLQSLPLLGFFIILGMGVTFCIQLLFGAIGFWSPDTWGPRFLFFTLMGLTSGTLFPLDILPSWFTSTVALTPFPFISYFQGQLALGRVNSDHLWSSFLVAAAWLVALGITAAVVWKKGLKDYDSHGG